MEKKEPKERKATSKEEILSLICEWETCTFKTYDIDEFLTHVDDHKNEFLSTQDDKMACQWNECGFVTNNREEFLRHIYFHPFHVKLQCLGYNLLERDTGSDVCGMDHHGRNLIPELTEDFRCNWENCTEIFNNAELFYRHATRHVDLCGVQGKNPKGGVFCLWDSCNVNFQNKYKLRDHLRSHTQEKVVACPTCGSLYANRTKFFDHIKRQIKKQDHQCSHCSKKFSSVRLLRDHMRQHVNHYKCCYCDMTCPSPSSLNKHILYRHGELRSFICNYCEHTCKTQQDLEMHHRTHLSNATYKCKKNNCSYAARCSQSLKIHLRKVHGDDDKVNRYVCHVCERLFSRGNYLSNHLVKKHKYRWPLGHCRFRYKCGDDGFYRLQTVRYESIELAQQMMSADGNEFETSVEMTDQGTATGTILELLQDNIVVTFENDPSQNFEGNSSVVYEEDPKQTITMQTSSEHDLIDFRTIQKAKRQTAPLSPKKSKIQRDITTLQTVIKHLLLPFGIATVHNRIN
uniref:C2H2-type domain-containing protein n=1 Tax=Strigamia maritima TaxID=126957 RepID=T1JP29_STRMM